MRVLIIANPIIGIQKEKRSIIEDISNLITRCGGTADIRYIIKPGIGKKIASRACLERYDALYAAGGDGTINDVATGLIGRNVPLGIIPLGTANGLARGLGIPLDPKSIIEILLKNKITTIDTGKISDRIFLSTAGIGFDANIAHDFNTQKTSKRTNAKYFYLAVKNYFLKSTEQVTLIVDGKKMERTVFGLTICNTSQYGSGAIIAPQANPRSGKLIAVLIPKFTVFKTLWAVKKLFDGSIIDIKELEYLPFKNLKISRRKADLIQFDGESFRGDATFNVSVVPSSLKIITP